MPTCYTRPMENEEIDAYEFTLNVFKAEDGYGYDYIIAQSFESAEGTEEVEFLERGNAETLYGAGRLGADGIKRFFS